MKSYTGLTFEQITHILENSGFVSLGKVLDRSVFANCDEIVYCSLEEVLGLEEWLFKYTIDTELERVEYSSADVHKLLTFRNNVKRFL